MKKNNFEIVHLFYCFSMPNYVLLLKLVKVQGGELMGKVYHFIRILKDLFFNDCTPCKLWLSFVLEVKWTHRFLNGKM